MVKRIFQISFTYAVYVSDIRVVSIKKIPQTALTYGISAVYLGRTKNVIMLHTPKEREEMAKFLALMKNGAIDAKNYTNKPIYDKANALHYINYRITFKDIEITKAGVNFLEKYDEDKVAKKRYTITTAIGIIVLAVSLINLIISLLRDYH